MPLSSASYAIPRWVSWKTPLIAEKTFRRLDAPELLAEVANGVAYVNGVRVVYRGEQKAAT